MKLQSPTPPLTFFNEKYLSYLKKIEAVYLYNKLLWKWKWVVLLIWYSQTRLYNEGSMMYVRYSLDIVITVYTQVVNLIRGIKRVFIFASVINELDCIVKLLWKWKNEYVKKGVQYILYNRRKCNLIRLCFFHAIIELERMQDTKRSEKFPTYLTWLVPSAVS